MATFLTYTCTCGFNNVDAAQEWITKDVKVNDHRFFKFEFQTLVYQKYKDFSVWTRLVSVLLGCGR